MEEERVKLTGSKRNRSSWLIWEAALNGFRTTDGRLLVKVTGYRSLPSKNHDVLARYLQTKGPIWMFMYRYNNLDITPDNKIIGPFPDKPDKRAIAHALVIRGNDRIKKMYKLHDSKGGDEKSVNWLPYDVHEKICYKAYSIYDVTLNV